MSTPQRQSDYISEARKLNKQLWTAWLGLLALQPEWNAEDYGNTLADGIDGNAGITGAQIGAVVFATANAIKTVMDAGNATNIANIL